MWKGGKDMEVVINANTIIGIAGLVSAIGVLIGLIRNYFKQIDKWNGYDETITNIGSDIQTLRDEQYVQTKVLQATLDGLKQLGCNGKVTDAKNELDEYINRLSHNQKK